MSKWIVFHFGLKLLTQEASVFRVVWNRRHNWKSRTHWLRQIGWEREIVVGVMPPQLPHWDSLAATSHPLSIPFSPRSQRSHHSVFLSRGGKVVQIKFLSSSRAEPSILSHLHLYMYTYCENGLPLPLHLISEESRCTQVLLLTQVC